MTADEIAGRKKAMKIGKSLWRNKEKKEEVFDMIGEDIDIHSGKYQSQELIDRYYECYMSDTEKEN